MSVKWMTYVFEHSPYTLGTRLVHLALADVANEDNDNLLWIAQTKIAAKAKVSTGTVSTSLKRMVAEGYLELVELRVGAASIYRLVKPNPSISEPPDPSGNPPGSTARDPLTSPGTDLLPTQGSTTQLTQPERARSFEEEFEIIWDRYPRKLNRKGALKAFVARRRAGVEPKDLWHATCNYAETVATDGRPRDKIMHGSTFFGPDDRYVDYVEKPLFDDPIPTGRRVKPGGDSDTTSLVDLYATHLANEAREEPHD